MSLIYEPAGSARSDAALALNIYTGCGHKCRYCYAPSATFNKRDNFDNNPTPRQVKFFADLEREARERAQAGIGGHVLLCFTSDPYQPIDLEYNHTRRAIRILQATGHTVVTLTKGGTRALRNLDLYRPRDEFASTLTSTREDHHAQWEPGAAPFADRAEALRRFHEAGVPTWVSLEPVLYADEVFRIIEQTQAYVGHFRVGKLNRNAHEKTIDWRKFAEKVARYCGDNQVPYFVKKELLPYWPAGAPEVYCCARP